MSKFCTSCGASLADNATFCTSCGAKLAATANTASAATTADGDTPLDALKEKTVNAINGFKNSPQRNTYIGIAAIAVAVILLIVILVNLLSGGYKGALKGYFGAIEDKDGKAYAKSVLSGDMIDYMEYEGDMDKDEIYDSYEDSAKNTYSDLKDDFGSGVKISFDVTGKEKIDKDDCETLEDTLNLIYDDVKVSKGYNVELEITVEGKDDEDEFDAEATVVKVDGDWIVMSLVVEDLDALDVLGGVDLGSLGSLLGGLGAFDY